MVKVKTDGYFLNKIITDLKFIIDHTRDLTYDGLKNDEVLLDSVMFRLIQISENSAKLTEDFKNANFEIPWRAIRGLRNRIVHEYGEVDLTVIYDTVNNDVPKLYEKLKTL